MIWTEELQQQLIELWGAGLSGSQCGEILGTTRNAVIGKAHRLRLPQREPTGPNGGRKHAKTIRPVDSRSRQRPKAVETPVDIYVNAVTILELNRRHCRFPLWDGDEPRFYCGANHAEGSSYCAKHHRRVYHNGVVLTDAQREQKRRRQAKAYAERKLSA